MTAPIKKPRRGRPPKLASETRDTRALLIRSGLEHLTEIGFTASGIDKILKKVGVLANYLKMQTVPVLPSFSGRDGKVR